MVDKTYKPPVDRGWAWIILLATFVQLSMTSTIYISGIYNIVFMEVFNQSVAVTSWCCSLHSSLLSIMGPVSSVLIKYIGGRLTALIGASFVFFGYLVPSLVPSFPIVFLFYGIMAGCGMGLAYLPFMVWIGFHFKTHRNLAFGFVTTAAGIGASIYAPLLHFLIQKYGWQGSMMLMAGITSHMFVTASLLRPIDFETDTTEAESPTRISDRIEMSDSIRDVQKHSEIDIPTKLQTPSDPQHSGQSGLLKMVQKNNLLRNSHHDALKELKVPKNGSCEEEVPSSSESVDQKSLSQPNLYHHSVQSVQLNLHFSLENVHTESKSLVSPKSGTFQQRVMRRSIHLKPQQYISSDMITASVISLNNPWLKLKDRIDKTPTGATSEGKLKDLLKEYKSLVDRKFLLFCVNLFFIDIGLAIAYIYLPALALANGSTNFQVAQLLSLIGMTNICSRLITGAATNIEDINIYVVYMATCGITGIVFFMTPIVSSNYFGQICLAVCFGIYGNVFSAMMSPITIDIVGISSLNVAHGIELLMCGIGMLIGPPLGGLAFQIIGSFDSVIILAGCCYFIGALVMMLIPLTSDRNSPQTKDDLN